MCKILKMALTLNKPKVLQIPRTLWTIHKPMGMVFTVRKNEKTAVVSFCKKKDCDFFTKALDTYYMTHGVYPQVTNGTEMFIREEAVSLLQVDSWVESELQFICIQEFFNLLIVEDIENKKNVFSLNGKVVCFDEYNMNYTIGYLDAKFELT